MYYFPNTAVFGSSKRQGFLMKTKLIHAKLYDRRNHVFFDGSLTIGSGTGIPGARPVILSLGHGDSETQADEVVDLHGGYVIPGLVDVHTHGRCTFDFASATVEQMKIMRDSYAKDGTLTLLPTIASAPFDDMVEAVRRIREAGFSAVHLEGRWMNEKQRGGHNPAYLAKPIPEELPPFFEAAGDMKVLITVAAELDPDFAFVREAIARGAAVSLGHTDADYDTAKAAIKAGINSFTHTYNCMPQIHHRAPGAIVAALESDDAYAEIISDGFHLHPAIVRMTQRVKAKDKLVLITDSMSATGCPDGEYSIAGIDVTVKDGKAINREGHIAGSTISLFDGLTRFMEFTGLSLEEALPYATENPARMVGMEHKCGSLRPGGAADFLVLDQENGAWQIRDVYRGGERM